MHRSFAIVPAAGVSARMGAHKLLLPFGAQPLIAHVLTAWTGSRVTRTIVVVRPDDAELAASCREFAVDVVIPPAAPPDMKASVRIALEHAAAKFAPADDDAWLLAPADLPGLSAAIIDRVLDEYAATRPRGVVPALNGQRGHPLALPWTCARQVGELAPEEGVNALVARTPLREIEFATAAILDDVDSPADVARLAAARLTKP
jgi:molybdenum cofactor cytidylyltransferase